MNEFCVSEERNTCKPERGRFGEMRKTNVPKHGSERNSWDALTSKMSATNRIIRCTRSYRSSGLVLMENAPFVMYTQDDIGFQIRTLPRRGVPWLTLATETPS